MHRWAQRLTPALIDAARLCRHSRRARDATTLGPVNADVGRGIVTRDLLVAIGLGVVSGLLMAASLRPLGWWPLAFVGLVPMIVAQYRLVRFRWCWVPVTTAVFVFAYVSTGFLYTAHALWFAIGAPVIWALIVGGFALVDRSLNERTRWRWFIILMPVMWVALDAVRVYLVLTGTDGYIAYSLYRFPVLIAPVSTVGIIGLNLFILMVNYTVALAVLRFRAQSNPRMRTVLASAVVMLAVIGGWIGLGVGTVNATTASSGPTVRVAAIQPGSTLMTSSLGGQQSAEEAKQMQAILVRMTTEAAARGAQLVVWPEEIIGFNPATAPASQTQWLRDLVSSTGVYLVTGYIQTPADGSYTNAAALLDPSGQVLGHYTKAHEAPFDDDLFQTGDTYSSYPTDLATIGMMICFDEEFPDTSRFIALSGANIIAMPAWQFKELASIQEFDKLALRAAEDRVPIVSADLAWDSAIVDANGAIIVNTDDLTAYGRAAVLVADVALGPRNAPFLLLGNWVGMLCVGATVVLVALAAGTHLRGRRDVTPTHAPPHARQ